MKDLTQEILQEASNELKILQFENVSDIISYNKLIFGSNIVIGLCHFPCTYSNNEYECIRDVTGEIPIFRALDEDLDIEGAKERLQLLETNQYLELNGFLFKNHNLGILLSTLTGEKIRKELRVVDVIPQKFGKTEIPFPYSFLERPYILSP